MKNPNPNCEGDCRFVCGPEMTTMMYYPPVYDKNGVNTNPDGNTSSQEIACVTCKKRWYSSTKYGKTTFEEIDTTESYDGDHTH